MQHSSYMIQAVDMKFNRYLWGKINWSNRFIVITGARGVGKTTLMLQYIKETFFFNQLYTVHAVTNTPSGDFLIDNMYTIEVGGKNKQQKQIAGIRNGYIAADNVEYSHQNRIPLWLFGFLY